MSGSVVHAAGDEALAIVVGLPRAEVEQRARQASEAVNDAAPATGAYRCGQARGGGDQDPDLGGDQPASSTEERVLGLARDMRDLLAGRRSPS